MKNMPLIPRLVSLGVILTLIIFLGITFYKVITPYLMPLFLAAITAILCQPLYKRCLKWSKGKPASASRLATIIVISCVMLPLVIGVSAAAYQMAGIDLEQLSQKTDTIRQRLNVDEWIVRLGLDKFVVKEEVVEPEENPLQEETPEETFEGFEKLPSDLSVESSSADEATSNENPVNPAETTGELISSTDEESQPIEEEAEAKQPDPEKVEAIKRGVDEVGQKLKLDLGAIIKNVGQKSLSGALGIGSAVGSALIALLIYVLALYYFFVDGPALIEATQKLIPVHVFYQNELLKQFESVVRAIILATLVAAISQGLATAGIMYLFGSGHFFLFFGIATMFAMIPLLGTWIVWGPYAIYLVVQGHYIQAAILTIFGAVVIGMMDNVIRTLILKDGAKLHPLLAFVSVLGGLQVLGLWGVFIGPTVASCLYALVKIFNLELQSLSAEQFGPHQLATANGPTMETNLGAEVESNPEPPKQVKGDSSSKDKTPPKSSS